MICKYSSTSTYVPDRNPTRRRQPDRWHSPSHHSYRVIHTSPLLIVTAMRIDGSGVYVYVY
eukprot:3273727-Prymnesium_polylepis.2